MRKFAPARVSYRDDFLILYPVYTMTGSFHISLFERTLHVNKIYVIQNLKHYACATRSSPPADRFPTETCGRFAFTWYRCEISYQSEILAPVQQPGELTPGWLTPAYDILWWYHVNKCRALRGNPEWTRSGAKVAPVSCKHPLNSSIRSQCEPPKGKNN